MLKQPTYISYTFLVEPIVPGVEILIAQLSAIGFESFVETTNGVIAYILKPNWNSDILSEVGVLQSGEFKITYSHKELEPQNWNIEWEQNFNPIVVDQRCAVRAPFHSAFSVEFDIIIEPKMSFGTGHHETTYLMIQFLLQNDLEGFKVLDMGCGTGILAILASLKGAKQVDAIDIDQWCYLNTLENIEVNNCQHINVKHGDVNTIKGCNYDLILANINRNILISDIPKYANCLPSGGTLFLSGFYNKDVALIQNKGDLNGLNLIEQKERNDWVALKFQKF